MAMNGSQRKLGYADVVYNIKTGKFYAPVRGDNYYELDVQTGGDATGDGITTATLPLDNPSREARADSTGLKTQKDFNIYIDAAVKEVEAEAGNHFSGDYNDLTNQPTIPTDNADLTNGAGYITLDEVPDPVLEGALVFKGNASNEGALPGDAAVGDIYFNEEDSHMYAWGEDGQWHKLNTIDDVDFSGYARLDGATFTGSVSVKDQVFTVNGAGGAYFTNNGVYTEMLVPGLNFGLLDGRSLVLTDLSGPDPIGVKVRPDEITAENATVTAKEFIGDGSKLTNLPGGAVGINEVLREGSTADAGQRLKFKITESDAPYELPSKADVIDLDGRFASRHGAMASFYQANEPFTVDTDGWDGVYQRASGYISAIGTTFNGLYQSGGGTEYFVWTDFGLGGAFVSITPQEEGPGDNKVILNVDVNGLEFRSPDLEIKNGSVTATEFIGDGSKLTNLPVADVDLDDYARLDGATFTDTVTIKDPDQQWTRVELGTDYVGVNTQNKGFSYIKKHELLLGSLMNGPIFISPHVESNTDPDWGKSVIRAPGAEATLESINLDNGKELPGEHQHTILRPNYLELQYVNDEPLVIDGKAKTFTASEYTVTAKEFIGDGSKLYNIPTPNLNGYARLSGAEFTGSVTATEFIGDGSKLTGVGLPDFRTLTPLS